MEGSVKELSKYRYDFYIASMDEAAEQIQRAKTFSKWIHEYLMNKDVLG